MRPFIIAVGSFVIVAGVACRSVSDSGVSAPNVAHVASGVTKTYLHLRVAPSRSSAIIEVLPTGSPLVITGQHNAWYAVERGGRHGFVYAQYVKTDLASMGRDAVTPGAWQLYTAKFLPVHCHLLEASGWFDYVDSHIDAVEYYDWPAFATDPGPAVGIALYDGTHRIAQIALKDRSTEDVVATLVHEAAHLSGISQIGTYYDENIAYAVEHEFEEQLRGLRQRGRTVEGEQP